MKDAVERYLTIHLAPAPERDSTWQRASRTTLAHLLMYGQAHGLTTWQDWRPMHIRAALQPLLIGRSVATQCKRLSQVRAFLTYLQADEELTGVMNPTAIRLPTRTKARPRGRPTGDVQKLLACSERDKQSIRDHLVCCLAYWTALRREEIARLRLGDIDLVDGLIYVRGKPNKEDYVGMAGSVREALHDYLTNSRPFYKWAKRSKYLFLSIQSYDGLTPTAVYQIITREAKRRGVEGIHPHALRHSYAQHAIQGGAAVQAVQVHVRHEWVNTTQGYYAPALPDSNTARQVTEKAVLDWQDRTAAHEAAKVVLHD